MGESVWEISDKFESREGCVMKHTFTMCAVAIMAFGAYMSAGASTDGSEKIEGASLVSLRESAGLEYFFNTNVTSSVVENASGAVFQASYTTGVVASTSEGGTTVSALGNAFDGYNAVGIRVTSSSTGGSPTAVLMYNNNGIGTLGNSGRTLTFNTQSIHGMNVSRKVYVAPFCEFARWMTLVHNIGSVTATVDVFTFGALGSGADTVIHDTSSGDDVVTIDDTWAVSYQDFVSGRSSAPRLGHVFYDVDDIVFAEGDGLIQWQTSFDLPAGERRIVLSFVTGQPNLPDAVGIVKALAHPNTGTNTRDYMTVAEINDVVNVALAVKAVGSDSSGSDTCFIATAAYGTPMAEEINTLRSMRDTYMLNNAIGIACVDSYYRFSPPIADFIAQSAILRAIVRTILTPIVFLGKIALVSPLLGAVAGLAMTILLVRSLRVFLRRRRAQIA